MQRGTRAKRSTIHNSMGDIREHAQGMAQDVRDIGTALKDVLIDKLTDMLKSALNLGARGQEAAKDAASDAREAVEERVQAHPTQSLLIAAGIGLAVGLIIRRRD